MMNGREEGGALSYSGEKVVVGEIYYYYYLGVDGQPHMQCCDDAGMASQQASMQAHNHRHSRH